MSKIAIVGCEASGKTVFTAALADYYRANQRVNQLCCMTPENSAANSFLERMRRQMRGDPPLWPGATNAQQTTLLKWALRCRGEVIAQIELLDFGGEVFRAAFKEGRTPRHQEAGRRLCDHILEADFIVVLISLEEIARDINSSASNPAFERDVESKWVTRGLLNLLAEHQASNRKVIVALTQADRPEYQRLLETHGGAKELFGKAWPSVSGAYPNLTVVSVASVSGTTTDGRPAPGFKTDGVLSVMKEFVKHQFGDCDETAARLSDVAWDVREMPALASPADFTDKLNQLDQLLEKLYVETAPVTECYKEMFQENEQLKANALQFVDVIEAVERQSLTSQGDSAFWREQERVYPDLVGTIRSFERYYQRKAEQVAKEAAREVAEHQRRLRQLEEERLAQENARREREAKQLERERRIKEMGARARAFIVRMLAAGLLLAVLAGIGGVFYFKNKAAKAAQEIAEENARQENDRKKKQQECDYALKMAAETTRQKESDARKEDAQKRKAIVARETAREERLTAEANERTAKDNRAKAEAEARRDEMKRKEAEVKEMSVLLDDLRAAAASGNLARAREKCAELRRKGKTDYHQSVARLFGTFCDQLERANNGNPESMVWIAHQYAGQVTEIAQDRPRAVAWYEKAALAGYAEAMFELASCAEVGKGCPRDEKKALEWYEKAARAKNGNALYRLGYFRYKGLMGLRQSREKAYELFQAAKANGCTVNNIDEWLNATKPEKGHGEDALDEWLFDL